MHRLQSMLVASPVILADGAMGTMLFDAGLPAGEAPQIWNVTHPERVRAIHRAYLDAGSQVILTNTFGGNRFRLARHGLQARVSELNRAGASILKTAVDEAGGAAFAAGDIGPSGELFKPLGNLLFAEAVDAFAEQAGGLLDGGVDLIWIETMSDLQEVQAAVEGVRRVSADVPVFASMTFEKHGRTMMGVAPEQACKAVLSWSVSAFGGNCGTGPIELLKVIRTLHELAPSLPLIYKPNAGLPVLVDGKATYDGTPASMAQSAVAAAAAGARIVGGCCGSTPDHLRAMRGELAGKRG